eukprot:5631140-Pyramimonas_sp.AAC.1
MSDRIYSLSEAGCFCTRGGERQFGIPSGGEIQVCSNEWIEGFIYEPLTTAIVVLGVRVQLSVSTSALEPSLSLGGHITHPRGEKGTSIRRVTYSSSALVQCSHSATHETNLEQNRV